MLKKIINNISFDSHESVAVSFGCWALLYGILRVLIPNRSPEYSCRLLTCLHGLIAVLIGSKECFMPGTPFRHPELPTTDEHRWLFSTSLGYFLFDICWCTIYQTETKLMMAHHIYSVFALYRVLFKSYGGPQACCTLGSMEVTNPLLQLRWFIRSEGFYPSALFTCVELVFMSTFIIVRVFIGTYFVLLVLNQPKRDYESLILTTAIYIMSWMFILQMVKYVRKKYCPSKKDE